VGDGVDPADRAVVELTREPAAKIDRAAQRVAEDQGEAVGLEVAAQGTDPAPEHRDVAGHGPRHRLPA